ncbi:MAG: MEDS domain-containing protein, partial [Nitrososphaeraceae archaeon]
MEAEKTSYRPFEYLDRMEGNNHIVLLYDNLKYADLIIARYIFNGLKKGESCIFFTSDNLEKVRKRLSDEGIDVESLRIYQTERDNEIRPDALSLLRTIREEATRGMKPPYR